MCQWFGFAHNKAFKRDLAHVAFLVCVGFGVYGAMQRLMYCVPAPLNAALVCKRKNAAISQELVSRNCRIGVQFQC
ncbi:hypothetical protein DMW02_23730 [Vibrio parahaemolyticus]|nr:hypothetical protein [Vibrio parahaemolyticus]EGR3077547.1 hypothetical protein [Vibrio parahaemolyticus]